jgi:hypothetical protein
MAISSIVKNTILVVLIILIGHFMIQNVLVDKKTGVNTVDKNAHLANTSLTDTTSKILEIPATKVIEDPSSKINKPIVGTERPVGIPSSQTVIASGGLDKAKQELLKFVDDDEDNMESFFAPTPTLKMEVVASDNCKLKTQDSMLPLNTTCDPLIQNLKTSEHEAEKANANSVKSISYDKKGLMILKEYENESTMNGGALFGGLTAYDSFNDNFQPISLTS